jgi:AraC-like DNA-binding protein
MERAVRYESIFDTTDRKLRFEKIGDTYRLSSTYSEGAAPIRQAQLDAMIAGLLMLCESAAGRRILPVKVSLMVESSPHPQAYEALLGAPVALGADVYALDFSAEDMEMPLQLAIPDVAEATDEIAERYVASLEKSSVANQVRQLLLQMLPSGSADQETIASQLYRSSSTLQRQLSAEGTSYRDVLEGTRRSLAQRYLRGGEHSHAQIAYLLGFSDQSNFARAFRRWTGMSPREYQKDPDS